MEPIALATTAADRAYLAAHFVTFDRLVRGAPGEADWPGARLPRATYQTPDGALWYAPDWWRLHDDAGGIAAVRPLFERRLAAATTRLDFALDPAAEWAAYLAGLYGACLREVTPETIALKEFVVARLGRMLLDPYPADRTWCEHLRSGVETLDGLTRPFAACDRVRFGGTVTRDRLIDAVRARYAHAFGGVSPRPTDAGVAAASPHTPEAT